MFHASGRRSPNRVEHTGGVVGLSIVLGGFAFVGTLHADPKVVFNPQAGSSVLVAGTSTLHRWSASTSLVEGQLAIGGQGADLEKLITQNPLPASATAQIPAISLKSGEGSGMDDRIYEALKAAAHPTITYRLISAVLTGRKGAVFLFDTNGVLSVAGVDVSIRMPVEVSLVDDRDLTVRGTVPLRMTSFAITPPVAMLGAIRSGDDIEVSFVWLLRRQ